MPQVSRSFMGATLSRPRSNAIAPLAPTVARLTPNPINQTAIDSKYNDMKSARANSAFNEWYGALPPAQAAEFHYGAMQTPNTLSINGVSGATERSGDELSALARQKAREHFTANVLPTDQEYNQLGVQHAIERHGGTVGGAVAPLNPGLGTNVRRSTTTIDPVTKERVTTTELPAKPPVEAKPMTDVDRAREGLLQQQTRNAVAATQPGGKDYVDPAIAPAKLANDTARVGISQQNADTAEGRSAIAQQQADTSNRRVDIAQQQADTAAGRAAMTPQMKAIQEENRSILQRIGQMGSKETTVAVDPNELHTLYNKYNENVKKMQGLGGAATQPATRPGGVGSGGGEAKGAPATATQPFQPTKIPEGHVPYDPSQPAIEGQEGVNAKGEPIIYKGGKWIKS